MVEDLDDYYLHGVNYTLCTNIDNDRNYNVYIEKMKFLHVSHGDYVYMGFGGKENTQGRSLYYQIELHV